MPKTKASFPKKLVFIVTIFLVLGGGAFIIKDTLIRAGVRYLLQAQCKECFGQPLRYDSLQVRGSKVTLQNPVFVETTGSAYGGYRLAADQIIIQSHFSLSRHPLSLEVAIVGPKVLGIKRQGVPAWPTLTMHTSLSYLAAATFTTTGGAVELQEERESSIVIYPFCFEVEGSYLPWGPESHLKMSVGLQENPRAISVVGRYDDTGFQVQLDCQQASCLGLAKIGQFFGGVWEGWQVNGGQFDGMVNLTLDDSNNPAYVDSDLILSNLQATHSEINAEVHLPRVSWIINQDSAPKLEDIFDTYGEIHVDKGASLTFLNDETPYWQLQELYGEVSLRSLRDIKIDFFGEATRYDEVDPLEIKGHASFGCEGSGAAVIGMNIQNADGDPVVMDLVGQLRGEGKTTAEIKLTNVGTPEIRALQATLAARDPRWLDVKIYGGQLSALLRANFQGINPQDVKVVQFWGEDVELDVLPWGMYTQVGKVHGTGTLNFSVPAFWQTLSADIVVSEGQAKLWGINSDFWHVTDISTELFVTQGVLQKSVMDANVAGLAGTIQCDWSQPAEVMKLHCSGSIQDLSLLLPSVIREGLHQSMDRVSVDASLIRKQKGLLLDGRCLIQNEEGADTLSFGCDLEKIGGLVIEEESLPVPYWQQEGGGLPPMVVIPHPMIEGSSKRSSGFTLKNGWFHGDHLATKHYLSPFIFRNPEVKLTGEISVEGTFDYRGVVVEYDAVDLVLDTPNFRFKIPEIRATESGAAFHYFDLRHGTHFGYMPIEGGSYLHKGDDLLFTGVTAQLHIDGKEFHFDKLTTQSEGVDFEGVVDVDLRPPRKGEYFVSASVHHFSSEIGDFQTFLSHLNANCWCRFPLQGQISSADEKGSVHFACVPGHCDRDIRFSGLIEHGLWKGSLVQAQNLKMAFDYDLKANRLNFNDVSCSLEAGDDSWALVVDKLDFTDISSDEMQFDIRLEGDDSTLVRLNGVTNQIDGNTIGVTFDEMTSHIAGNPLKETSLTLVEWCRILDAHSQIDIAQISALKRLKELFFVAVPKKFGCWLQDNVTLDEVTVGFDYTKAALTVEARGSQVSLLDRNFDSCTFKGRKEGNIVVVDRLQLDDLVLAADMEKRAKEWKINFLGIELGDMALLGMEGQWRVPEHQAELQINLLEWDLSKWEKWATLPLFLQHCPIAGKLKATGSLSALFDGGKVNWRAYLNVGGRDVCVGEGLLRDFDDVVVRYRDGKLLFENIDTEVSSRIEQMIPSKLQVGKIIYDQAIGETRIEAAFLAIPHENLDWLATLLHLALPDFCDAKATAILRGIKKEGLIKMTADLEMSPAFWSLQVGLGEGTYHFDTLAFDLKNCFIEYDPFQIKVTSQCRYRDRFHGVRTDISLTCDGSTIFNGQTKLYDIDKSFSAPSPLAWDQLDDRRPKAMTIHWRYDQAGGFCVQQVNGLFCGLQADLKPPQDQGESPVEQLLQGTLGFDGKVVSPLLPTDLASMVRQWHIGGGYGLDGTWQLSKLAWGEVRFDGELQGREFSVKGVTLDALTAKVHYTPEELVIEQLHLADPAGLMDIERFVAVKDRSTDWFVSVPKVQVNDFRPSILRRHQGSPSSAKSLVIRNMEVHDIVGNLSDRKTLVGRGHLDFINSSRRHSQSSLFAIPSDIIARIGLDIDVLNPVVGTVLYDIHDGRVWLNDFRDVFSEGRVSRFYLPSGVPPSYIDFNGALSVRVRMKQYNLIFKLAELFTVNIAGTLSKPTFTVQKQPITSADMAPEVCGVKSRQ